MRETPVVNFTKLASDLKEMEKKERRTGVYLPSCVRKRVIDVQRYCRPKREEKTGAKSKSVSKDQNWSSP